LVGAPTLIEHAHHHRFSALTVERVIEPGPARLRVCASSPQLPCPRDAILDVPEGRAAVRLLRDPFSIAVTPRQTGMTDMNIDPDGGLVFSTDGRRLFARGKNGALVVFSVPNSPHAKPGKPVVFTPPAGHVVVAVGHASGRGGVHIVTENGDESVVHALSKRGGVAKMVHHAAIEGDDRRSARGVAPLKTLGVFGKSSFCFVDEELGLVMLTPSGRSRTAATWPSVVVNNRVLFTDDDHNPKLIAATVDAAGEFDLQMVQRTTALPGEVAWLAGSLITAAPQAPTSWLVVVGADAIEIDVADGDEVVGLLVPGSSSEAPCLVSSAAGSKSIHVLSQQERRCIVTTSSPIASMTVSSDSHSRAIAYVTRAGDVGVYGCSAGAIVLSVAGAA
jgi:hypothetical protein